MKIIKAYEDATGKIHRQRSDALSADGKAMLRTMANKLNAHKSDSFVIGTFEEALQQNISPRRLMRMYAKLWNMKKQYDRAVAEEQTETTIKQEQRDDELPF